MPLGYGKTDGIDKTDGIGKTLAKRASGDLDSRSVVRLRVARRDAIHLLGTSQELYLRLVIVCLPLPRKFFRSSMLTA